MQIVQKSLLNERFLTISPIERVAAHWLRKVGMRYFNARVLLFLLVAGSLGAVTSGGTIDFEGLADSTPIGITYSGLGVTFTNATAITAGISLNEFEFPPFSGINVAFDDGGPITISFASPQDMVGAYFTYTQQLTFQAFDSMSSSLGMVTSAFNNNLALSGDPGSSPNEFLSLSVPGSISSVVVTGDPAGGSFTMDDVTFSGPSVNSVPEPASGLLVLGGVALSVLAKRSRHWGASVSNILSGRR